jgi:hypothetical protein
LIAMLKINLIMIISFWINIFWKKKTDFKKVWNSHKSKIIQNYLNDESIWLSFLLFESHNTIIGNFSQIAANRSPSLSHAKSAMLLFLFE